MNPIKKTNETPEMDAEISPEERSLLDDSIENSPTADNDNLRRSALDLTDADGDLLNETSSDLTGDDLDIPGVEMNDAATIIGEEDEENNLYSKADTE